MFPWLTSETAALLLNGLAATIALTLLTSAAALGLGVCVGWLKLSASPAARSLGTIYVEVFRNVPALVAIVFWAYALPNAFSPEARRALFFDNNVVNTLSQLTGLVIPYYALAAALGLTLNTSAYIAELFRAGVGTLAREHWEAARALGASPARAFGHILLPHGLRAASPAVITRLIHNMKNTALAAFVAVPELFKAMQTSITRSFYAIELLLLTSVLYWLSSWVFAQLLRRALLGPRKLTE
ncbi:MAG: ABC transporter permease subunit [Chloroflexi bacterium]|nr:ABC transporter permease subunit [Chloroflexota bacterium]